MTKQPTKLTQLDKEIKSKKFQQMLYEVACGSWKYRWIPSHGISMKEYRRKAGVRI